MPTVFVISRDWTLRAGVRAELRELHFDALGMESLEDAAEELARGRAPSAVVLDATAAVESPGGQAVVANLARNIPLIVVASRPGVSGAAPPGLEGAAAVLYRPVSIGEIVARVRQVLAGQAA